MKKDIDMVRTGYLAIAEFMDAWRLIPRLIVGGYGFLTYHVFMWYMKLKPEIIEGCDLAALGERCIIDAPTGMHTSALTAVGAFATAIFAFYAASGRKWENGIRSWRLDLLNPHNDNTYNNNSNAYNYRSSDTTAQQPQSQPGTPSYLTEDICPPDCTCSRCMNS